MCWWAELKEPCEALCHPCRLHNTKPTSAFARRFGQSITRGCRLPLTASSVPTTACSFLTGLLLTDGAPRCDSCDSSTGASVALCVVVELLGHGEPHPPEVGHACDDGPGSRRPRHVVASRVAVRPGLASKLSGRPACSLLLRVLRPITPVRSGCARLPCGCALACLCDRHESSRIFHQKLINSSLHDSHAQRRMSLHVNLLTPPGV